MLGRAAVLRVDRDRRERLAGGQQHAGPDLADVVAALLADSGDEDVLQTGLQRALTVSVEHPDRYDAAVTLAEFQLAAGRAAATPMRWPRAGRR